MKAEVIVDKLIDKVVELSANQKNSEEEEALKREVEDIHMTLHVAYTSAVELIRNTRELHNFDDDALADLGVDRGFIDTYKHLYADVPESNEEFYEQAVYPDVEDAEVVDGNIYTP